MERGPQQDQRAIIRIPRIGQKELWIGSPLDEGEVEEIIIEKREE
jgi:hypothetical protein